ncbi:MAG: TraB/GumN family protein [Pseudomonadota bacterium]|uniref:TraB family protein n=1 Tax=anaerobic digester metagenome TaxID=1263854 RepID=A0A485M8Q1_9ZZZZ|nr:TraB/GumN family protein [Pseudomonadota bacterium]HON37188.1 TraB/GumN family protein [Deltaproteobacteria bacterium]HPD20054.1 TraB/GumN family protein [Deltaproteobacteria bacterium]HRS54974.1 TraB/GumN family protein [Desulfomonilia bacterium]HRV34272.1 TraB/GumN family protein [Desulfomonilia bacterium]
MNLSTSPQENGTDCRNVSRAAVQAVQTPTISARQGRSAWCGMGCAPALLTAVVLCCLMWVLPGLSTAAEDGGGKVFLWSFAAEKGTLYLLGSVHVLRPDVYPLDERIDRAYEASRRVVFEADVKEIAGDDVQQVLKEHGMYGDDATLKEYISGDTFRLLQNHAQTAGIPPARFERMKPWLCAVTLSGAELSRLGFRPELGIDAHYAARAEKDGKERIFLESARFQVELLAGMPGEQQEELLRQALRELEVIGEKSDALVSAWKRGDADALEAIVGISLKEYPRIRKALFTDRNLSWMSCLEKLLESEGDTLVIVGAGHLVGEDGILNLLRRKGYNPVQH